MKTIQEKYNGVLESKFSKAQFLKDAKRELPQFLSNFSQFNDSVQILKSKGILTEVKKEETSFEYECPVSKYSVEAVKRGCDYELLNKDIDPVNASAEEKAACEKVAIKNLDKDEMYYLNILAGESDKVDKHDKMVDVKKGNEVDTFNGMKKAELKEDTVNEYDQTDAVADYIKDYYKNPKTGKSLIDDEIISDFYKTHPEWEEQADGTEEGMEAVMDNFKEFISVNYESGSDYMQEKAAQTVDDVIDPEDYILIGQGYIKGFGRPHKLTYDELETLGRKVVKSLYKGDFDKAKAIFVQEQMSDQEMDKIAKYGTKTDMKSIDKLYKLGNKFSTDFDYDGMLKAGLKLKISTPVSKMQQVYDSFEDVNYHSENGHLGNAIEYIEDGDKSGALKHLKLFRDAIRKTLNDISEGHCNSERENNEATVKEALNKKLSDFGPDLVKRLETVGLKGKVMGVEPDQNTIKMLQGNDTLAYIHRFSVSDNEQIVIYTSKKSLNKLQKVIGYFNLDDTSYGPEKDAGWVVKNVINKNPGDIMTSKVAVLNGLAQVRIYRFIKGNSKSVKTTDKATGDVDYLQTAAEGKKVYESRGAFDMCVSAIQDIAVDGDLSEREAAMEMMIGIADKYDFDMAGLESQVFHGDDAMNEGRRAKSKGGKVVTENDYETGGYVEAMGPMFERAVNMLINAWEEWKMGPMTEPGMIEHAKRDIVNYLETQMMVDNLEEKKGKDHDGDGDVDGDDYMAAKDKAIKKSMGKNEIVKENIKAIISKILEEGVINEAATKELANMADTYGDFEGMKQAIISLQDVVTDIESYYDKTRTKIQKVYDTLGDIRNDEGLKVGGFLAPAIEQAFNKDLRPAIKGGFTKGLDAPKVRVISKKDVDMHNSGESPLGEVEKETVYSRPTVNGTLQESKKNKK